MNNNIGGEDNTARAWLVQPEDSLGILKYTPPITEENNKLETDKPIDNIETRIGINAIDIYSPVSPVSIIVTANEDGCLRSWDISTRNFATPLRWVQKVSLLRCVCEGFSFVHILCSPLFWLSAEKHQLLLTVGV